MTAIRGAIMHKHTHRCRNYIPARIVIYHWSPNFAKICFYLMISAGVIKRDFTIQIGCTPLGEEEKLSAILVGGHRTDGADNSIERAAVTEF